MAINPESGKIMAINPESGNICNKLWGTLFGRPKSISNGQINTQTHTTQLGDNTKVQGHQSPEKKPMEGELQRPQVNDESAVVPDAIPHGLQKVKTPPRHENGKEKENHNQSAHLKKVDNSGEIMEKKKQDDALKPHKGLMRRVSDVNEKASKFIDKFYNRLRDEGRDPASGPHPPPS